MFGYRRFFGNPSQIFMERLSWIFTLVLTPQHSFSNSHVWLNMLRRLFLMVMVRLDVYQDLC